MGNQKNKYNNMSFKPFLEGKRIYLREVRLSDITDHYYRWMNDPQVCQYLETRFSPQSFEKIESYVRQMEVDPNSVFLAIIMKRENTHIGNIKIGPVNWFHRFSDVSILIGEKKYWGKGLGAEAIQLIIRYAFETLNLHKLTAGVYANNIGSIKAFKKARFVEEGIRKEQRFLSGKYIDEVLLGIVRS